MRGSGLTQLRPDEPKPPLAALAGRQLVHLDELDAGGTGTTTAGRSRMPGSTVNGVSRSVLSRITRTSPR